jgi:hypothetical protein
VTPEDPEHAEWLSDGRLRQVEEVHVDMKDVEDCSALEHLRQLPLLRELKIEGGQSFNPDPAAVFPAFIPSSLKILTLDYRSERLLESLLRHLPSVLQASVAGLVELHVICADQISAQSGAALARVLQTCSPTLKSFRILSTDRLQGIFDPGFASEVAWGLASCCEGLERLEVPWAVFKSLPPNCPTFTRLAHLHIEDETR